MATTIKKRKKRNKVAAARGRLGGLERKRRLSRKKRREIAQKAANTRWGRALRVNLGVDKPEE